MMSAGEHRTAIIEARSGPAAARASELRNLAAVGKDRLFFSRLAGMLLDRYETDPATTCLLLFVASNGTGLPNSFLADSSRNFKPGGRLHPAADPRGAFRKLDPDIAARAWIGMVAYEGSMNLLFPRRAVKASRSRVIQEMMTIFLEGARATTIRRRAPV